jgi:hypothetical protein
MEGGQRLVKIDFKTMIEDQQAFNRLIFDNDNADVPTRTSRLKDLVLGMVEESLEFIRTFDFKVHRRQKLRLQNVAHAHEELIDMFKYWLSIADVCDFPFERLEELYWAKSRVVRYRYQEEWLSQIDKPCVIVDIDDVLADYIVGICDWAADVGPSLLGMDTVTELGFRDRLRAIKKGHHWVNNDAVGLSHMDWQKVKHDFRTRHGKVAIPTFSDTRPFLEWCRSKGWLIVLVTSRPVDQYPNIFTDTVSWLARHNLPFDYLWWTTEKSERLEEALINIREQVVFAVDDSPRYVSQFASKGIRTYWLRRGLNDDDESEESDPNVVVCRSLIELMDKESHHHGV